MITTETATLYDDDNRALVITGSYEYYDDELTEAGTVVFGSETFNIDKIERDGVDVTNEFTADELSEMAYRCLEGMYE